MISAARHFEEIPIDFFRVQMDRSNISRVIKFVILVLSCCLSFLIRQFANVVNEPLIHEFDPHFNWSRAQFIDQHGLYEFLGWFDNILSHHRGRPVGETSYPGVLMATVIVKLCLECFHIVVPLIDICIFMGPSSWVLSTLFASLFGQLLEDSPIGVVWAIMTSFVPGMISRSVRGAYDCECLSLFVLVLCLYGFARALTTGSILWSTAARFVYGYMALTWGGYAFVSNCIPLFAAGLVAIERYSWCLHIAYSVWAVVGTLLTSSVPFIGDKTVTKPEHFAMIGFFVTIQIWGLFLVLYRALARPSYHTVIVSSILVLPVFLVLYLAVRMSTGLLGAFSGRLIQMVDPTYASKKIPIIASLQSMRQPSGRSTSPSALCSSSSSQWDAT
jgi:dolichyl-diphosphooligosaccharide--protein glycosyltransferase